MLNAAASNQLPTNSLRPKSFLARSMVLFSVLCAGNSFYRNIFLCIAFSWLCSYGLLLIFTVLLACSHFLLMWYLVMAITIVLCGVALRETARKKFISANFTVRAS